MGASHEAICLPTKIHSSIASEAHLRAATVKTLCLRLQKEVFVSWEGSAHVINLILSRSIQLFEDFASILGRVLLNLNHLGPVTDYGSTIVHWMRNRQPRFKGGYQGEMERPSPSYIVDVRSPNFDRLDLLRIPSDIV
jgi:hypothetical protein